LAVIHPLPVISASAAISKKGFGGFALHLANRFVHTIHGGMLDEL
jgi:hypothetical protein